MTSTTAGMFEFKIIPDDGALDSFEITAGMRDLRMWEKTNHKRSLGMLSDEAGMSASVLWEIAHAACLRQQRIPSGMTEAQFAEAYDIELIGDDESEGKDGTPGPTPPAA